MLPTGDLTFPFVGSFLHSDEWPFLRLCIHQTTFEVKVFSPPCTFLLIIPSTQEGGVFRSVTNRWFQGWQCRYSCVASWWHIRHPSMGHNCGFGIQTRKVGKIMTEDFVWFILFSCPFLSTSRLSCEAMPNLGHCSDDILLCALICFPDGEGQCFAWGCFVWQDRCGANPAGCRWEVGSALVYTACQGWDHFPQDPWRGTFTGCLWT